MPNDPATMSDDQVHAKVLVPDDGNLLSQAPQHIQARRARLGLNRDQGPT